MLRAMLRLSLVVLLASGAAARPSVRPSVRPSMHPSPSIQPASQPSMHACMHACMHGPAGRDQRRVEISPGPRNRPHPPGGAVDEWGAGNPPDAPELRAAPRFHRPRRCGSLAREGCEGRLRGREAPGHPLPRVTPFWPSPSDSHTPHRLGPASSPCRSEARVPPRNNLVATPPGYRRNLTSPSRLKMHRPHESVKNKSTKY